MAFELNRLNGQNYAENIVNPALSFNVGTWTVNSGTGTASLDNSDPFEGVTSLEIQNNTPASDITVTNSSQTTTIESTGTYQLSLYLRKKAALQVRTVDVLIYKNAVLLDTQTCVLGSDQADKDKNGIWVRFQSDTSYNFLVNDEVTFQFTLKGVVTADLTSAISIDGVMLNANSRGNVIVPAYSKPIKGLLTGWESRFQAATQALTTSVDNLITITGTSQSSGNITLLDTNGKVIPIFEGDVLAIDFGCTVITPAGLDNYVHVKFVVNNVVYRALTLPLLKGSGNDDEVTLSATLPVGADFFANGLEVYIYPNTALSIKDKYISVFKAFTRL